MKKNTENFLQGTQRELTGIYIRSYDGGFERFIPSEEPLTVENFGIAMGGNTYTVDDFRWFKEDGSDRDFRYDDSTYCIGTDDFPDEVFCLLNTTICLKYAKHYMAEAKEMLDNITYNEAKRKINEAIIEFENLDDDVQNQLKLQVACDTLSAVATECTTFAGMGDLFDKFEDASNVIFCVLKDLDDISNNS